MSSLVRIPRVYTDTAITIGESLGLPKRSSHHLVKVLRLQVGDAIELFNGDGLNYQASLSSVGKTAQADVHSSTQNISESPLTSRVIQGISRGDKMDTSIQKSVELGAHSIVPIYTQHSIKPLVGDRSKRKHEHWQQIAVAASEQCGRSVVPKVINPMSVKDFLNIEQQDIQSPTGSSHSNHLKLILDPQASTAIPTSAQPTGVCLVIGPEIGFTDEEIRSFIDIGYTGVHLGARILRTETAAPTALSVLQTLYGDFCR